MLKSLIDICITYILIIINTIIIAMLICYAVGSHQPNKLLGHINVNQDILSDNAGHSIELNGITHVGPASFYTYINNHIANELTNNPHTHLFVEGVRSEGASDQYHFSNAYIKSLNDQNIPKICALDTQYNTESTPLYALIAKLLGLANQNDCYIYYAIRNGIPVYDVDAIITNTPTTKEPPPIHPNHPHTHQHITNPPKTTLSTTSSSKTADASINHIVQSISNKKYIPVSEWFEHHPYILSIASILTRGYINIRTGADTIVTTIKYPLYHWHILKNPSDPNNDPNNQYIIHYRNTLLCNGMEKYPANHIIVVYGQAHIADIEAQWIKRHPNWHVTKHQYNTEEQPTK